MKAMSAIDTKLNSLTEGKAIVSLDNDDGLMANSTYAAGTRAESFIRSSGTPPWTARSKTLAIGSIRRCRAFDMKRLTNKAELWYNRSNDFVGSCFCAR
ncbi:MAG: hypothetical protein NC084_01830 [Bacteroides sp.]|nr:hypothetical protein [Eubacterium sp.]MCM1417374.1 hypothetical protein [Roseburia sp.]MCM1461434.1 hypothetical protein [Bacteroides sp.]